MQNEKSNTNSQNSKLVVDLAEYSRDEKNPPKDAQYKFKVGKDDFITESECLTGKEILELAGKNPYSNHQLYLKLKGHQSRIISYEEAVCFTLPGIEKFTTIPLDPTDGYL